MLEQDTTYNLTVAVFFKCKIDVAVRFVEFRQFRTKILLKI